MSTKRIERINRLLRDEIAVIIQEKVRDPRLEGGIISITAVDVSKDIRHARVFFCEMGGRPHRPISPEDTAEGLDLEEANSLRQEELEEILNHAARPIQTELSARVKLKFTPHLKFFYDRSLAEGMKMEALFHEIAEEEDERNSVYPIGDSK